MASKLSALLTVGKSGPFRAVDAAQRGIPRSYLARWEQQGVIEKVARGLYRLVEVEPTELSSIAEVARRAPGAILCLLSALRIHELTTTAPHAVWLMIPTKGHRPRLEFIQTEVVYASGPAFTHGVEVRKAEGVEIKLTTPAKTVADCFRYRRHVGEETAYAALRDYLEAARQRKGPLYSVPLLIEAAKADRIYGVLRPSLEVLVA
jgi:predicted transcriptional regulator of viral defense system